MPPQNSSSKISTSILGKNLLVFVVYFAALMILSYNGPIDNIYSGYSNFFILLPAMHIVALFILAIMRYIQGKASDGDALLAAAFLILTIGGLGYCANMLY